MKKCPYCSEEIQDDATKCRFCGEYLDKVKKADEDDVSYEHFSIEEDTKEKIKKKAEVEKTKNTVAVIGFIILIIILFVWQWMNSSSHETKKKKTQNSSSVSMSKKPTNTSETALLTRKTSVDWGIGVTYDQVMTGLSDYFLTKKSTSVVYGDNYYTGKSLNKYAEIEIIGNKSNIEFATIYVDFPPGRPDIDSENSAFTLRFLKNIVPEWEDSENWLTNSIYKLVKEISELHGPKEIIIGNKKISADLFAGTFSLSVEKANVGTVKDSVVLKNGKIIKGKITEETDEFIAVKESIGTEGFVETKYNKLEIDKIERDTDTDPVDTRKYR